MKPIRLWNNYWKLKKIAKEFPQLNYLTEKYDELREKRCGVFMVVKELKKELIKILSKKQEDEEIWSNCHWGGDKNLIEWDQTKTSEKDL